MSSSAPVIAATRRMLVRGEGDKHGRLPGVVPPELHLSWPLCTWCHGDRCQRLEEELSYDDDVPDTPL
eukprot:CAMPEP_0174727176 /NCGR_PEP_ID=MMETSP1094-20130205/49240_1 /TAXON_ID=156173 /ORGANISM="Chrysochromulina brevifilum, Strain UTEX LB 985" /LENGTH=67 /DNA_ID=CAMNT_0015928861 /DNA_START=109 /DNA_END=312 /DNA_ORIENTATION=-